jgi:hypothetical protein
MAEIFLCPRGQMDDRTRRELRKAGVVPVEVDDPSQCQLIRPSEILSHSDMLWAALDALCFRERYGSTGVAQRERLTENLLKLMNAARTPTEGAE